MESEMPRGVIQGTRLVVEVALIVSLFFLLDPMYNGNGQQRWPKLGKTKFYTKQELDVGKDWAAGTHKQSFEAKCGTATSKIYNSDACACVRTATDDKGVQKCLLNNDIPLQIGDGPGFLLIVPLAVWFMASSSARMITMYYAPSQHIHDGKNQSMFPKILRQAYIVGVLLVVLLPILLYNLTPNKDHFDGMSSAPFFLLFVIVTIVSTVLLSFDTALSTLNPMDEHVSTEDPTKNVNGYIKVNWAFYTHMLVAAPCIAVVMHILNNSFEFAALCNTALLLATIFSLDGFSHFVALYWVAVTNNDKTQTTDGTLDRDIALVKLFSWGTQGFLILLFFLTEYTKRSQTFDPNLTPPQAISAMVFIVLVLMNLAPDLVREFMDFHFFQMISFRYYGDFVLRIGVFWYIVYLLSVKAQ